MNETLASIGVVLATYLIGSIPFGFLIPKGLRGIDIRQHGSGNIGATNVGRVLGFRYFVLVMVLDLLKGFLPTFYFPDLVARLTGDVDPWVTVATVAAAIVGHNFPVYLRFRGGKGVATSLGAVLALDPVAGGCAAVGFLVVLAVTRIVSISSILGAACFLGAYAMRVGNVWDADHRLLTITLIILFALLVVRHRSNLARLWKGTEPRVSFRRKAESRTGSVRFVVLAGVLLLGVLSGFAGWALSTPSPSESVECGPFVLQETSRVSTGRQRAGDLVFSGDGSVLAVACPRYNRLVLFDVQRNQIKMRRDVQLDGRPVALAMLGETVIVLQRPHGDARHLEEGFWDTYSLDGERVGSRYRVGWDPDDLVVGPSEKCVYVLTSGHAEGETGRPDPALIVVGLGKRAEEHVVVGRIDFSRPGDDPEKLYLSESGGHAAVSLAGTEEVSAIDLTNPESPIEVSRVPLVSREIPTLSRTDAGDQILMPVATDRDIVTVTGPDGPVLISTLPNGSALELVDGQSRRMLGQVPLRWSHAWNEVKPVGLAVHAETGLLAVANRAGGIHLVAFSTQGAKKLSSGG